MSEPRLGQINFINCLPLEYGLSHGGFGRDIAIYRDVPARLNSLVTGGQLDVSPVSSIIYARNVDKLLVLPEVSISAPGALESILLVSKRPLAALDGARIALTAKSATSHVLLKIVLHYGYNLTPEYFTSSLPLAGALEQADAALYIGDEALFAYHNRRNGYHYYDLGDEWRKLTGQAMVYALWVVNRAFAAASPEALALLGRRVRAGFDYGLGRLGAASETLQGKVPLSTDQIRHYIGLLDYRLTGSHIAALKNFYRLAHGLGLIAAVPDIELAVTGS